MFGMATHVRNAFEMRKQPVIIDVEARLTVVEAEVGGVSTDFEDHIDPATTAAHTIGNINGLQAELDGKQDAFTGLTGTVTVVTAVDFGAETTTTVDMEFDNGVLISVT